MKLKILALATLLLALPILTAVAQATPLTEKNNDKFQSFGVTATVNAFTWVSAEHQYIPSMDNVNKLVVNGDETFITYDITIGSNTYKLGEDFTYTGHVEFTYYDVTAWMPLPPPYMWPSEYRESHTIVDYMFDFSAIPGGIDGTLQMRAMDTPGDIEVINSLAGTGDLQNVQIKATISGSTHVGTIYTITHSGLVSGWPE